MAAHELKTWPEYFAEVFAGRKKFEIRKNDRNYQVNDILILQEWDPDTQEYTGGDYVCRITYILDVPDFVKDEMVVMSIEPYSTFFDSIIAKLEGETPKPCPVCINQRPKGCKECNHTGYELEGSKPE